MAICRQSTIDLQDNVNTCKISITHPKQTPTARFPAISPAALRDLTSWNTSKQVDVNPKRHVSANLLRSESLNVLSQFHSTSSPSFILQQRRIQADDPIRMRAERKQKGCSPVPRCPRPIEWAL